jgi:thioredoxin reductase (NADPH)
MSDPQSEIQRQAFPVLTDEQIGLLRPFGEVHPTQAGDVLFEVGDATYPLVVVLSGQTAILDRSEGSDQLITTTGPGGFNGELGLLTGQMVFAACVVREPGEVLLIPPAGVHEAIETIPVLSDVLITAFAWRRQLLMRAAAATLTLIGPDSSPSILRLQEFVSRNRIPSRWFPPEDPAASALLDRFDAHGDGDVWVVVRGQKALRDPTPLVPWTLR